MRNLSQWLEYIETAHPHTIDMGLARVSEVLSRLSLNFKDTCLITVAGTNGKGTTCRFIEQACIQSDFKVGVYSSPHIEKFNERIRLQGCDVCDQVLTKAFAQVYQAANHFDGGEPISLSYFEYATLCSLVVFSDAKVDICLLEVGLGGRLDATNILDADIGVITSIGLDHQNYLGETTELIAAEKAGIIKPSQRVVIGYSDIHESVKAILKTNNSRFLASEIDFGVALLEPANNGNTKCETTNVGWINTASQCLQFNLAEANIPPQNIMTAIATLQLISTYFNCKEPLVLATSELAKLIPSVSMAGRFQTLSYSPHIVLDVAHNEDSARYLVRRVQQMQYNHCHIVIGMLKDKNIEATIDCLAELNASWYCADLPTERGEKAKRLTKAVSKHKQNTQSFDSVKLAVEQAIHHYDTNDMILVVGSFILASSCISTLNELGIELTLQGKH
jgi:dihydrofolate synthase/folylpolyglutamate synthase